MHPEDFSASGDDALANGLGTAEDVTSAESSEPERPAVEPLDPGPLSELEVLIGELKEKVTALREGDLDAATLEARLRELTEIASRASSTLDAASR